MLARLLSVACALIVLGAPVASLASVKIDASAANATLNALSHTDLTLDQALKVARLPGNLAMIRKVNEISGPATEATFAQALMMAAHGVDQSSPFGFGRVKAGLATTLQMLNRIQNDKEGFADWVDARVAMFTPQGLKGDFTGYLIAGGPADGFAFDGPDFYLNVSRFGDDLGAARVIMAHEIYHAVQNAAQAGRSSDFQFDEDRFRSLPAGSARACYAEQALFGSLMAEGTATYVGDPRLLPASGAYSLAERARRSNAFGDVSTDATLLEMSIRVFDGAMPISFDDVYAVDFLGRAPLYDLGYVMAQAIAAHDGNAALGGLIGKSGSAFVLRYEQLSELAGSTLPHLGQRTLEAAGRPCQPSHEDHHADSFEPLTH